MLISSGIRLLDALEILKMRWKCPIPERNVDISKKLNGDSLSGTFSVSGVSADCVEMMKVEKKQENLMTRC